VLDVETGPESNLDDPANETGGDLRAPTLHPRRATGAIDEPWQHVVSVPTHAANLTLITARSRAIAASMSSRLTGTFGHEGLRNDAELWRGWERSAPLLEPRVPEGSLRAEGGPHVRTVTRPTPGRLRKVT
jgi:hypothetical protein